METFKIATVVSVLAAGVAVGLTCAIAAMAGRAITPEVVALLAILAFVICVPAVVAVRRRRPS